MSKPPKQAGKKVTIVIKHPVKPQNSDSKEDLSSSSEDLSSSWDTQSDRETGRSSSPEPMEVEEQVTAIQHPVQQAIGESSRSVPIEFPPIPRQKRSSLKLKEQEEHALTLGPEPGGAQLPQEAITFEELVKSTSSLVQKEVFESPKMRFKRLLKELDQTRKELEAEEAEILASTRLSDRATSADQHKSAIPPATNLDQQPGAIPPATDQDSKDVTPPASPYHQPWEVPPATSPYQHLKVIPRPTDRQAGHISPGEDSDDVTPPVSPDEHGANIPPATNPYQQHVGGNPPATDLHSSNTPPATDLHVSNTPPVTDLHASNPLAAADQDFEDVTPPESPDHHSGNILPVTNTCQYLGNNPPATDLRRKDSPPATLEGFEDVTPPASPDHHAGDIPPATSPDHHSRINPLVKHHDHGGIPPAASQDQIKRDISLATFSDQHKGDIPSPSPGTPIQSNSQVGDRFLGAVQSGFSPDGVAVSHGWSPNPMPTPEPTETHVRRWHGIFTRQTTVRTLEPEPKPDAAERHKPSRGT